MKQLSERRVMFVISSVMIKNRVVDHDFRSQTEIYSAQQNIIHSCILFIFLCICIQKHPSIKTNRSKTSYSLMVIIKQPNLATENDANVLEN